MPEPTNNGGNGAPSNAGANANNTNNDPNASSATQDANKGGTQDFDTSKLTDEQFAKIFEDKRLWTHSRFKDLNDKAKKAEEYEAQQKEANEAKLLEEKKYTELLDVKGRELADWKGKYETEKVNNSLVIEAQKLGAKYLDDVLKLVDRSAIKVTNDGITGISEALTALKESKAYLFGEVQAPTIGGGSNPSKPNTGVRFKLSQIQDPTFYQAHEKEITEAYKTGNIENDMPGQR